MRPPTSCPAMGCRFPVAKCWAKSVTSSLWLEATGACWGRPALAGANVPVLGGESGRLGFSHGYFADGTGAACGRGAAGQIRGGNTVSARCLGQTRTGYPLRREVDWMISSCIRVKPLVWLPLTSMSKASFVNSQRSDGLIVATPLRVLPPMHSPLAAPSCIHDWMRSFLGTDVSAYLSGRPIVVDGNSEIKIVISEQNETYPHVSCDGQTHMTCTPGDTVTISKKPQRLRVDPSPEPWFLQNLSRQTGLVEARSEEPDTSQVKEAGGYDIIGDVHGCQSLGHLASADGVIAEWNLPTSPAYRDFVGDIVDRGPRVQEALHLVRGMVEAGQAQVAMGNHEYNALGYCTRARPGSARKFLSESTTHGIPANCRDLRTVWEVWPWMEWFSWMVPHHPIVSRRPGIACGSRVLGQTLIDQFRERHPDGLISDDLLHSSVVRESFAGHLLDRLLRGPICRCRMVAASMVGTVWCAVSSVPSSGPGILEPMGMWSFSRTDCLRISCIARSVKMSIPSAHPWGPSTTGFVGHYWLSGRPRAISPNVACLDYSAVKYGKLVAYRFDGEKQLSDKFVWIDVFKECRNHDQSAGTWSVGRHWSSLLFLQARGVVLRVIESEGRQNYGWRILLCGRRCWMPMPAISKTLACVLICLNTSHANLKRAVCPVWWNRPVNFRWFWGYSWVSCWQVFTRRLAARWRCVNSSWWTSLTSSGPLSAARSGRTWCRRWRQVSGGVWFHRPGYTGAWFIFCSMRWGYGSLAVLWKSSSDPLDCLHWWYCRLWSATWHSLPSVVKLWRIFRSRLCPRRCPPGGALARPTLPLWMPPALIGMALFGLLVGLSGLTELGGLSFANAAHLGGFLRHRYYGPCHRRASWAVQVILKYGDSSQCNLITLRDFKAAASQLAPEVLSRFRQALELGRWPDGRKVSPEQKDSDGIHHPGWNSARHPWDTTHGYIDTSGHKGKKKSADPGASDLIHRSPDDAGDWGDLQKMRVRQQLDNSVTYDLICGEQVTPWMNTWGAASVWCSLAESTVSIAERRLAKALPRVLFSPVSAALPNAIAVSCHLKSATFGREPVENPNGRNPLSGATHCISGQRFRFEGGDYTRDPDADPLIDQVLYRRCLFSAWVSVEFPDCWRPCGPTSATVPNGNKCWKAIRKFWICRKKRRV